DAQLPGPGGARVMVDQAHHLGAARLLDPYRLAHESLPPAAGREAWSERPGIRTAVDQEVLARDVAGLGAAQEGTGLAELHLVAVAAGRLGRPTPLARLLDADAGALRRGLHEGGEPVGVEHTGQQVVDRHVVGDRLAREPGDEAGQAAARAVG